MYENEFSLRLAKLRLNKGVSARDMSLSLGQNPGYIKDIESGKALPSMSVFFFICDYLDITPAEFFETDKQDPEHLRNLTAKLNKLNTKQLDAVTGIVDLLLHS